eukprot:6114656-Alexandrium_andersonii.AAC.1
MAHNAPLGNFLVPNFEAVPGPAQFQVRTPEASLQFARGGLRIEAACSTDGPSAECGLQFGHPAM